MFENTAAEGPAGFLAAVTELLAKLPSELWRTGNDRFAAIAVAMDALSVQLDCARVGLVQEAESRGVVSESHSASSTDWLLANSFHLEPADAARTVDLARLCALPKNQVMAAAVAGGTLTVRKAMTALRQLGQVEHALQPGKREEALASLTFMAQTGYDRHVIAVGRTLMALVGADRSLERNETALRSLSSLKLCPLANGMVAISGQLDPESGAVLTAALDPLSAPTPCEANGGRDPRQAGSPAPSEVPGPPWPVRSSHRRPSASSPATPRSSRWSWAPRANPWTSDEPNDWSPRRCWPRYGPETKAARSQAADGHLNGPTRITSNTGSTAGRHPCSTSRCSAATTLPLAPLGGTPTFVHQRDLTATVTAFGVTWQT